MITSDRNQFLAAHVTVPVKAALRTEAAKRGVSLSRLVFEFLNATLRQLEYDVPDVKAKIKEM